MNSFGIWFTLGLTLLVIVAVDGVRRVARGEPVWKELKRWLSALLDVLSGGC